MKEPSYSEIELMNPYKDRPYLISNMIISSDGNTLFTNNGSRQHQIKSMHSL